MKKEDSYNTLKSAIGKIGFKNMAKIAGGGVGVIAVSAAALPVFGAMMIMGLGLGCVVVIGSAIHAYNVLRKHGIVKPVEVIIEKGGSDDSQSDVGQATDVGNDGRANDGRANDGRGGQKDTPHSAGASENVCNNADYLLWDHKGKVHVFVAEPSSAQVVLTDLETLSADEDIFSVINNTKAALVKDSNKLAVKIRILSGNEKGRTGWVSRAALLPDTKSSAA